MELIESVGEFQEPLLLNSSKIYFKVYGLRVGSLFKEPPTHSHATGCPTTSSWKIYFPSALTICLTLVLAAGGYKTIQPRLLRFLTQVAQPEPVYSREERQTAI